MSFKNLANLIFKTKDLKNKLKIGGTYIAIDGPQFSTYAESLLFKSWKCDVIGMTNMPEARLAREAEIRYVSISMVTDYDCWHRSHSNVTVEQVLKTMKSNTIKVQSLLISFFNNVSKLKSWNWEDDIYSNLDNAIVTNLTKVKKQTLRKLSPLLKRYINKR